MDDVFDYNGPFGGKEDSRSREELGAENEQLREELHHQREENKLLAELLAGEFEEGDGEIDDSVEDEGDFTTKRPRFVISDAAIDLFEALPELFTLDEVLDAAERLSQLSEEATNHLRHYLDEKMVRQEIEESGNFTGQFAKTGRKPYF